VQRFHGGFGRYLCPADDPYNLEGKFWDSECETRFAKEGYVFPSLLVNTATVSEDAAADKQIFRKMKNMGGNLYAIGNYYDASDAGTENEIWCWLWNPPNWDKKGEIVAGCATVPTVGDLIVHGTQLFMCFFDNNPISNLEDHHVAYSSDGITWTATTNTTDLPAGAASDQTNVLLSFGTTLLIALWDNSAGQVLVYGTTNEGVNWYKVCAMASAGPALGMVAWVDQDGNSTPWIRLRQGWGQINLTNWTSSVEGEYVAIVNVPAEASTAYGIEEWGGVLHVPEQEGQNRCWYSSGALVVESIGLNKGSGIVSDKQGHVTAMARSNIWLFVAYGGLTATTKACVFAWDGEAWHFIYKHGTANQKILDIAISSADDNIVRLHIAVQTAADQTTIYYLDYILDNPEINTSMKFNTAKGISTVRFDAGMPEISGAALRLDMAAGGHLDTEAAATQYITVSCAGDFASPPSPSFFSDALTRTFGTGGVGDEFKSGYFTYTFYRDATTTNRVAMQYPVLKFRKKPATRWARYLTIDIKETAGHDITRSKETIISNLKTAKDSQTLLALVIEQATSVNVDITDMKFGYIWERSSDMPRAVPREGFVAVTVETLL